MISYILKLIVIVSAFLGTWMSGFAGRAAFMGGSRVFMYFTIQSNIAVALLGIIGCILLIQNKPISNAWCIVKLVGAVAITLTGVVFTVVLAPTLGNAAWNLQNVLTHVVVPIAAVADFFVVVSGREIRKVNVIYVIIPPLLYAIYAGIGYVKGWEFSSGRNYPYFFLNWGSPAGAFGFTKGRPYMGCGWWILALLLYLLAIGWLYLYAASRIGRSNEEEKEDA